MIAHQVKGGLRFTYETVGTLLPEGHARLQIIERFGQTELQAYGFNAERALEPENSPNQVGRKGE